MTAHDHDHDHEASSLQRSRKGQSAMRLALAVTTVFMLIEFVGGILTGSLALVADAGHMLSDVAALGLSLVAFWMAGRPFTASRTYGFQRVEILAALINGLLLIGVTVWVFYEAATRFGDPPSIDSAPMLAVAASGLVANVVCAYFLGGHAGESLNVRGAFLHVIGDLLGSIGAIIAAIVMLATKWYYADPLISVLIGVLVLFSAYHLLRESLAVLLEFAPAGLSVHEVGDSIRERPGVASVHDLHIWTVTSGHVALSAHVQLTGDTPTDAVLSDLCRCLHEQYGIDHVTVQPELASMHGAGTHELPRCTMEFGDEHHERLEIDREQLHATGQNRRN